MRRALDTNVLVYAHLASLDPHERVRDFVLRALRDKGTTTIVTPMVLHEFVHVVTDSRRFDPPVAMSEALAVAGRYLDRSNVECVPMTESSVRRAFALMTRHRLGRRRIADTLLVATLLEAGVSELATCNVDDFRVFDELAVIDACS